MFKVGDLVEYELCDLHLEPRWNFDIDNGSGGKWESGVVINVDEKWITVEMSDGTSWLWPNTHDQQYSKDQWSRPGYLRLCSQVDPKCVCGSQSIGCQTHSHWCDLSG